MPVVKFDVSGTDPDEATKDFEPPKPGVYRCKVHAVTYGYSKGDDGKPDKTRPRLEVVYEITERKSKGSRLWDYVSFGEASEWKLDQFLQAFGLATKTKRKGSFNTDNVVGKACKVRVKADADKEGNYRGKVASVFAIKDDEDEETEELEDEELEETEDEEEEEVEDEEVEEEEEEESEARHYDLEELQGMTIAGLTDVASDLEVEDLPKTKLVKKMAQYIFDNQPVEAPEEEEEEEEETEDDGYDELGIPELKEELKERGLKTIGTKPALIKRLREADAEGPF